MIRYIIWDAGGTLFDTYPAVVHALRMVLRGFGRDASPEWVLSLCRESIAHTLRTLADMYQLDEACLEAQYRRVYADTSSEAQPPFAGVRRVCRYICEIGGQNFIVTHRAQASLEGLLDAYKMAGYFTDCVTKDDPYPRKPDPTSILALIERYDLDRSQCLAVGDRDLDILAGQRAGIRTCFFGDETHAVRADVDVTDFVTLYRWLLAENVGTNREFC